MDAFSDDEPWLPKVPKVLRVDKKAIFALAAEEYNLIIDSENTCQIDDDNFVTKILINNVQNRNSCQIEAKEFTGAPARTKQMSLQNAYHSALAFLEQDQRIIIDDYNAPRVSQLKQEVLYHSSWSMLFEDKLSKLKTTMKDTEDTLRGFLDFFDSTYELPLSKASASPSSPAKKRRSRGNAVTGASVNDSILRSLSESLSKLRAQILSLLGGVSSTDLSTGPASV